jgi:hypothetical protein
LLNLNHHLVVLMVCTSLIAMVLDMLRHGQLQLVVGQR